MQQLSERYRLPLKTSYNTARGFFIQLHAGAGEGGGVGHTSLESLPSEFIKLSKQKSTLSFVTADLASIHYVPYSRKLWGVQNVANFLGTTKLQNYTPCQILPLYSVTYIQYVVLHACTVCVLHAVNMAVGKHSAVHVCCVLSMHECVPYIYMCCMMCGTKVQIYY